MSKVDRKIDAILLGIDIIIAYHHASKNLIIVCTKQSRSLYNDQ